MGPSRCDSILCVFARPLRLCRVRCEFARRYASSEHLVELLVSSALGLGVVKVEVDAADDALGCKDESRLAAEIPLVGIKDEGKDEGPECTPTLLNEESDGGGLGAQPTRGDFGHGNVGSCADRDVVQPAVDDDKSGCRLVARCGVKCGETAGEPEQASESDEAPEVEEATTKALYQIPLYNQYTL